MLAIPSSVTIVIIALMAILFLIDLSTSFSKKHRDFRSIIVSVGVLGTFIGVFIGLLGFDANDIRGSVPRLLEGMKVAFLTSVVGMGLSVSLSIFYRLRNTVSDDEVNVLHAISQKLDKLDHLANLQELQHEVQSQSQAQTQALGKIRAEISESQHRLDANFARTNETISNALQELSRSASEEIVRSLETVIKDFNNNLTEQFGDNFKQLNSGVANLLEWQNSYRDSVQSNSQLLDSIATSLNNSQETIESVAKRNAETMQVYDNLSNVIQVQKQQTDVLKEQMREYSELSTKASTAFATMQSGFGTIQQGMQTQSESVAKLTEEISRQLPESLQELENTLSGLTNKFARDYQAFLERYRLLMVDEEQS